MNADLPSIEFDRIIGHIENIVISPEFQQLQTNFLDKHCMRFSNAEENKLYYFDIFKEYTSIVEEFITNKLLSRCQNIDLDKFMDELRTITTRFDDEIFELLYSLHDFCTFKTLILDYKEFKLNETEFSSLNDCFTITKLQ